MKNGLYGCRKWTESHSVLAIMGMILLLIAYAYFSYLLRDSRILFAASMAFGLTGCFTLLLLDKMTQRHASFEVKFITLFAIAGLTYMAIFAPMKAPDEQSHFAAAYRYSNFLMGEDAFGQDLMLREDDRDELRYWWLDHRDLSDDYHAIAKRFSLFADNTSLTRYEGNPNYVAFSVNSRPPQLHIIPALGITLARLLGLGAIPLIYIGRVFSFISFSLFAYAVIRILPFGKVPMAAIYLSPLVLQLATSFSYDGPIISMSMLFAAICFRLIRGKGEVTFKETAPLMVLSALLAPCKIVYIFLTVLVAFIPSSRFRSKRHKIGTYLCVWGCAAVSLLILSIPSLLGVFSSAGSVAIPQHNSSGAPNDPGYVPSMYISDALANPIHAIGMGLNTIYKGSDIHIDGFFGALMAWGTDLTGPRYILLAFFLLNVMALLSGPSIKEITTRNRIISAVAFFVSSAAIYASMLSGWTAQNSDSILGIQGRYFYPLWPLIVTIFYGLRTRIVNIKPESLLIPYCYFLFLYAGWLFNTICLL